MELIGQKPKRTKRNPFFWLYVCICMLLLTGGISEGGGEIRGGRQTLTVSSGPLNITQHQPLV